MCHVLLGLPLLALPVFWIWSLSVAAPVYGVVAVASLALYAYALKAMRMPRLNGAEAMVGASGTVAAVGDQAVVVGVDGLRLRARKRSGA